MTEQASVVKSISHNHHPEYQKGMQHFNAITSRLIDNNIGFERLSEKCVSVTNIQGQKIYIRFYFNAVGGWGNAPCYTVGVYSERKTTAAKQFNGKTLLITSQRGIGDFEGRFIQFMSDFTGRDLLPLKLTH